jgi:hypothetical protein
MNSRDIELVRRMNQYIKETENERCERMKKAKFWTEEDRERVEEILKETDNKIPQFEKDLAAKYFKYEGYPEKYIPCPQKGEWNTTVTISDKVVCKDDYRKNLNLLYAQLMVMHGRLFVDVKQEKSISQFEWEKITKELIEAYNFAADDSGYQLQFIKK